MSAPFIVWLSVGIVTTVGMIAVAFGLVRHVVVLGRTLRRFQEEVTAVSQEITREGDRAGRRASAHAERRLGRR